MTEQVLPEIFRSRSRHRRDALAWGISVGTALLLGGLAALLPAPVVTKQTILTLEVSLGPPAEASPPAAKTIAPSSLTPGAPDIEAESLPQPAGATENHPLPPLAMPSKGSETSSTETATPPPIPASEPPPAPASDPDAWLPAYRQDLHDKLLAARAYPYQARAQGQEGRVTVSFRLTKSGALVGDPVVVTPSRYALLNRAALDAVRRAQPFAPLGGKEEEREFTVSVEFSLR